MADSKLSNLPAGTTILDADLFYADQAAASVKVTGAQIKTYAAASMAIGGAVAGASAGQVLFIDGSGNLAGDTGQLFFDPNGLGAGKPFFAVPRVYLDNDGIWFNGSSLGIGNSGHEGTGAGDGGTTIAFGNNGHLKVGANLTAPTASAGDSVTGTDLAGVITLGVGHTGTTLTFGSDFISTPFCVVTNQSGTAVTYSVSSAAITISGANAGDTINYFCVGQSGGL